MLAILKITGIFIGMNSDLHNYKKFQQIIKKYYKEHGRTFPWRETTNPYHILVSELMLQQTQTFRVLPKYEQFLATFPTVHDLAVASLQQVLLLWQGLGYNRRALMLQKAAQQIVQEFSGFFPDDPETLQTLPGVGPYTASAVATFAFNHPCVFIETNIRTVYIYHFFSDVENIHDKELLPLIAATVDTKNPRDWYYALMDYGVMLKKLYKNPNRKSVHYAKQSRFTGSDREIRGKIIRELIERTQINVDQLIQLTCPNDQVRFKNILEQLLSDQLVIKNNDIVQIA